MKEDHRLALTTAAIAATAGVTGALIGSLTTLAVTEREADQAAAVALLEDRTRAYQAFITEAGTQINAVENVWVGVGGIPTGQPIPRQQLDTVNEIVTTLRTAQPSYTDVQLYGTPKGVVAAGEVQSGITAATGKVAAYAFTRYGNPAAQVATGEKQIELARAELRAMTDLARNEVGAPAFR
jgi:hypothetical protein